MIINQASLAGIYKSFSTVYNEAFDAAPSMWDKVAMEVPSTTASNDYAFMGAFPTMREWIGDRVIKDLSAHTFAIKNKDFEATVEVDRNSIADDQIGVYTPMIKNLGRAAKVSPDQLIFGLLPKGFETICYDGQYFFDTDHPVAGASKSNSGGGSGTPWYVMDLSWPIKPMVFQRREAPKFAALDKDTDERAFMRKKFVYGVSDRKNCGFGLWQMAYGSKQTLDATALDAALTALAGMTDDYGVKLGIQGTTLVVPTSLQSTAIALVETAFLAGGGSNPWYHKVELLVVPWL